MIQAESVPGATPFAGEAPISGARLFVNLAALRANYRQACLRAGAATVAPVVKADGYGLGAVHVARAFAGAKADMFFVARLAEAIALRPTLPHARIFVLDGLVHEAIPAFIGYNLIPVLNALEEVTAWASAARVRRTRLSAALHIDTGMNRSGLGMAETHLLAGEARGDLAPLDVALIMSHLASADEPKSTTSKRQLERFRAALQILPPAPASLAASAGIELGSDYRFDIVRPGLALYGGAPLSGRPNPYEPAVRLTAPILQVRRIEKGEQAGYGGVFTARRPSILVTAAIGYADGLLRSGSGLGRAILGRAMMPFAGRISMDLTILDATDAPSGSLVQGAEIEFLGREVTIDDMARAAGTVGHEVLTSLKPRGGRFYGEE